MANFLKVDDFGGYDESRSIQVLKVGQTTSFYVSDVPADTSIHTDDPTVAVVISVNDVTAAAAKTMKLPNSSPIHKVTIRGESPGSAQLATDPPLSTDRGINFVVVGNNDRRRADGASVDPDFKKELDGLSLKQAAIRVAEDQRNSSIGRGSSGGGLYGVDPGVNWCGAWAFWCYKVASAIKDKANPLGTSKDILLSPQKAISWAISSPLATVLRYKGPAPMDFSKKQADYFDVDAAHPIEPGDICMLRDDTNWKHVDMVYEAPTGDTFRTIDGNQGLPSMKIVTRSLGEKLTAGPWKDDYKHAFVTLKLPF